MEVDGLRRTVDDAGLEAFHLVGYSGGGAVSLAFAARYPERLTSLAIFEPADLPGAWDAREREEWQGFTAGLGTLSAAEMLGQFTRRNLRPGVEPPVPPPGPAPDWMAKRPAGLSAMMAAFAGDDTDRELFRACRFPVYLAHGLLTAESMLQRIQRLAGLLPDVWIEAYRGVHHFGPPQRTQPAHYADSLRDLWTRAELRRAGTRSGDDTYAA